LYRPRDDVTNYEKEILWLEKLIDVEGSYFMKVRSSRRTMSHKIRNIVKNTLSNSPVYMGFDVGSTV